MLVIEVESKRINLDTCGTVLEERDVYRWLSISASSIILCASHSRDVLTDARSSLEHVTRKISQIFSLSPLCRNTRELLDDALLFNMFEFSKSLIDLVLFHFRQEHCIQVNRQVFVPPIKKKTVINRKSVSAVLGDQQFSTEAD